MAEYMLKRVPNGEQGYTYIALLILIAVMCVGLATTGEVWSMAVKRDREAELLFAGNQFRQALTQYYRNASGQAGRYPMKLEDLLKDPRTPANRRYLRKIFADPISNSTDWELVKGPGGEILGVHSKSEDEPIKKSNFRPADQAFEGKLKYSDWVFAVPPTVTPPSTNKPAGAPARPLMKYSEWDSCHPGRQCTSIPGDSGARSGKIHSAMDSGGERVGQS